MFVASGLVAAGLVLLAPPLGTRGPASAVTSAASEVVPTAAVSAEPPASSSARAPREPPARPPLRDGCPADTVRVQGSYCPFVAHRCAKARPARPGEEEVCVEYRNEVLCEGAKQPIAVCMDAFEYPNRAGVLPAVLSSFDEAEESCTREHKRLCTLAEWRFACEGEAITPYPTGLAREPEVCRWDAGNDASVTPTRGRHVAKLLEEQDRRVPSGRLTGCRSAAGVFDLGGNVREWVLEPTQSKTHDPFASVIAGGSWGPGPAHCRATDDAHAPASRSATLGFRCCTDLAGPAPQAPARDPRSGERRGFRPILPPAGLP